MTGKALELWFAIGENGYVPTLPVEKIFSETMTLQDDASILIVDDDSHFRSDIVAYLQAAGYRAVGVGMPEEALDVRADSRFELVMSALPLPGIGTLAMLGQLKRRDPSVEVVIMTDATLIASAREALRLGASDYLMKPLLDKEQILDVVRRVLEARFLKDEKTRIEQALLGKEEELEESRFRVIQHSQDVSALYAAEKEIASGLDLQEVCRKSVEYLSKLMGIRSVLLWSLSEDGSRLGVTAQSGFEHEEDQGWDVILSSAISGPPWEIAENVRNELTVRARCRSALYQAVMIHQRPIGYFGVFDPREGGFTGRDQEILSLFSASVALAIENARLYDQVKKLATHDGLTEIFNRRRFEEMLALEVKRSLRYREPVSLIFIDVDDFKQYNDRYGHLTGDLLLKELAVLMVRRVRSTDSVCRYGGEEFTIILPSTPKAGARLVAEAIRARVEDHPFPGRSDQPGGTVTVSVGIAECPADAQTPEEVVKKADTALYRAKAAGRNRICE